MRMRSISTNWKNKLKNYNNGLIKITLAWICIHYLGACSPVHRFNRLVKCYPFLLDSQVFDTLVISRIESVDTTFILGKKDTIYQQGVEIHRHFDSIRLIVRERNCTTFQQQTIIKPSKIVERYIKQEQDDKERYYLYGFIILLVIIVFLTLLK